MLPAAYAWLAREPGPRMIVEAIKQFGVAERAGPAHNPRIIGWQRELEAAGVGRHYVYDRDEIPWCGLFMAVVALRANPERRPERDPPTNYLWALSWRWWGRDVSRADAALGDVLVFKRKGGGHVGLYVGHDAAAYHVLGGNQNDRVSIVRIARSRLVAARRPNYRVQPANVRSIALVASGRLSDDEA